MAWTPLVRRIFLMSEQKLDERKLNLIKVGVIRIEKENIVKSGSNADIVESIRKYIEKVVDGKC